jgi:hypothetical protein
MKIIFTRHALEQIEKRNIAETDVAEAVANPSKVLTDAYDAELAHYIGKIGPRFLRVVVKIIAGDLIVVTAFYDRRIKDED